MIGIENLEQNAGSFVLDEAGLGGVDERGGRGRWRAGRRCVDEHVNAEAVRGVIDGEGGNENVGAGGVAGERVDGGVSWFDTGFGEVASDGFGGEIWHGDVGDVNGIFCEEEIENVGV